MSSSFFVALITIGSAYGQTNLYENLIDPTAICRIDDLNPLRYEIRQGIKQERDSEGFMTMFEREGAGVITHIWATVDKDDTLSITSIWNLYIDGKLILRAPIKEFFSGKNGLMRPPLDTLYPFSFVCNVQIPFKKSIRFSSNPIGNPASSYYAIAWKPVADSSSFSSSFSLEGDSVLSSQQKAGESIYYNGKPEWGGIEPSIIGTTKNLPIAKEVTIFDTVSSGLLSSLQLRAMTEQSVAFDSVRLRMYWDDSPYPSVDVPVSDFFMDGIKNSKVKSFYIHSAPGFGYESYFPMPFRVRARVTITNLSHRAFPVLAFIQFVPKQIDNSTYGYFHTHFSESNPIPFGVLHPVLHDKGRGKLIGVAHSIPKIHHPSVIEGDPIISIDSNKDHFIRYTGGEDYYNGGWWFFFQEYNTPFAGHYNRFQSYYRLHVLDPLDFTSSIDFNMQHGVKTDVEEHVRTVAYYYKEWTPFWCDRDTIRSGEQWHIGGSGYAPDEKISISLGNSVIKELRADEYGKFDVSFLIPFSIEQGITYLFVNNVRRPKHISVLASPIVFPDVDYSPIQLHFGDSLLIKGKGFITGEKIRIYLDSILISMVDTIIVRADHSFEAFVRMPYIADRRYRLSVVADLSGQFVSKEPVYITRDLDYEFEKLVDGATWYRGWLYKENLTYRWYDYWSKQGVARFEADSTGDTCSFRFYLPVSDTFDVKFLSTVGTEFGDYTYSLDGKIMGFYSGYELPIEFWINVFPSDTMKLGVHYLSSGWHTFSMQCTGKNDSANRYWCSPDVLQLRPTTVLPLSPGTITDTATSKVTELPQLSLTPYIYPNPATTTGVLVGMTKDNTISDSYAHCSVTLIDATGRKIYMSNEIPFVDGEAETLINTEKISAGSYYVVFTYTQGKETREFSRLLTVTK